jgi:hypothetical protein
LQQDEQQESQAVASGDYSAASADAQQAYQQSETVAGEGGPDNTDETWTAQLNESWANSDQQTAEGDAQTADSYAAAGFTDDAQMYAGDAQGEEQTADASAEEGQYGDPVGPEADAPAEEAPADEAPADEAPADDSSGADDSSS